MKGLYHRQRSVAMLVEREIPLIEDDICGSRGFGPRRPKVAKAFDTEGWVLLCHPFGQMIGRQLEGRASGR